MWAALLAVLVAVGLTIAACGGDDDSSSDSASSGSDLTTVKVGTTNPMTFGYYPMFTATALDYFKDEGIELELVVAGENIPLPALIENGQADLAIPGASEIAFGLAEGGDLDVLFDPFVRTIEDIVTTNPEIQALEDVEGTTVGLSEDEDRAFMATALAEVGLSPDDVETVVVGSEPATVANALTQDRIQSYVAPFVLSALLQARGLDIREIAPKSLGATPSVTFVASSGYVEENTELLEGFFRALAKGVWAGQVAPEAVRAIYKQEVPDDWKEDPEIASAWLDQVFPKYEPLDPEKIGELVPDRWQQAEDDLLEGGELEQPVDLVDALDDRFIAPANDFDRDEVEADANAWLEQQKQK